MTTGTFAFPSSVLAAFLFFQPLWCAAESGVIEQDYDGFTVGAGCARRGAVRFEYKAKRDSGSLSRRHSFALNPHFPGEYRQTSADSYRADGPRYDRGHPVPANRLDPLEKGINQSSYMTDLLPQTANTNRGA